MLHNLQNSIKDKVEAQLFKIKEENEKLKQNLKDKEVTMQNL